VTFSFLIAVFVGVVACATCSKPEKPVQEVVQETGVSAAAVKIGDMMRIASYGVFHTRLLSGEVKCKGKVPEKDEIRCRLGK
jgi:hypothetical protein